jgi:hypothetical protein
LEKKPFKAIFCGPEDFVFLQITMVFLPAPQEISVSKAFQKAFSSPANFSKIAFIVQSKKFI